MTSPKENIPQSDPRPAAAVAAERDIGDVSPELHLKLAVEAAALGTWTWDVGTDRVWWNDENFRLLGLEPGDRPLSSSEFFDCVHADDRESVAGRMQRVLEDNETFEAEFRVIRPGGEVRWMNGYGRLVDVSDGRRQLMSGIMFDVTDRREARISLAKTESAERIARQEIETLYQTAPLGMCLIDKDLRYIRVNDRLAEMNGIPAADHLGKTIFEVIPELAEKIADEFRRIMETGKPLIDIEINGETPLAPGVERWWRESWNPYRNAAGEIVGISIIAEEITEKRVAEKLLAESQERYRLAQEAGSVGIWDWNINTNEVYWSETMWSLYGEEPDPSKDRIALWLSYVIPDDRERMKERLVGSIKSKLNGFKDEFRIATKDGGVRWFEAVARIQRDENGRATRMYGVNVDITDRKKVEHQIRRNERRLRLITDAVPALISYVDDSERYRFVNQAYLRWFGIAPGDVIGRSVREVIGDSAYQVISPKLRLAFAGEKVSFETYLDYRVAGRRYVIVSYVPDVSADGSVSGIYALVTDLTELKQSKEDLRSTEQRMSTILESATDVAIFSVDLEGKVTTWNIGAENLYGYREREIIGESVQKLDTPENVSDGVHSHEMTRARLDGRFGDERWQLKKDGTRFFASGVMMPLYNGTEHIGYAKIAADRTDRRLHAEALERANDELEDRVLARTQELADAVTALRQEMDDRRQAEEQRSRLLQRIVTIQEDERARIARDLHDQLGQQLTALRLKIASAKELCDEETLLHARVNRLGEIAERIDSEMSFLVWELRPTALDDLGFINAAEAFAGEWSRLHGIPAQFHAVGLESCSFERETETQLYRIIQEALNNILKYSKATSVSILLERRGGDIILIVEDDGVGFDPQKVAEARDKGKIKGLGLVGMRERATLLGGELEIESHPGRGTTIYIRAPYTRDEE